MKIQLLRHATTLLQFGGHNFIVDPMLSPAGAMDPVPGVPSTGRNPLVELPFERAAGNGLEEILDCLDAIIVTHLHRDHFDPAATAMLPHEIPLFCQPGDGPAIRSAGFEDVREIKHGAEWLGVRLNRTGGCHGRGKIGEKMGPVSGFVLQAAGEAVLYITGDTIWCDPVSEALIAYKPQAIIAYAGEARFASGDPITMGAADVAVLAGHAPGAQIIAVHMEAWNHCRLGRRELKACLAKEGLAGRVAVPGNGEIMEIKSESPGGPGTFR